MLCLEYSLNYLQVLLCMCTTLLVEYIIYDQSWWAFIVGTMQLPVLAKYSSANCQWTSTSGGHTQVTLGKTTSNLMSYYVWFTNSQSSFLYGLRVVSGCNTYIYIFKKKLVEMVYDKTTQWIQVKMAKPPSQRMQAHLWEPPKQCCRHRSECGLHAPWNSYWESPSGFPMVRCPMSGLRTPLKNNPYVFKCVCPPKWGVVLMVVQTWSPQLNQGI